MSEKAIAYARENGERFLQELIDLVSIPSVGTRSEHDGDMEKTADFLTAHLTKIGMDNAQTLATPTGGHPIVYADWLNAPDAPTVLFYGHYDVQPAEPFDLWDSPPFAPEVRDNYLYGRGTSDDKGQVMIVINAVEALLKTEGKLPVNIKILLEGEEEGGGAGIEAFIPENQDLLHADVALVCDTSMLAIGRPSIVYGLRGMSAVNFTLKGPSLDLHSVSFGGAINNPVNVITRILAKMQDDDGRVLIPGFYDDIPEMSEQERELLNRKPLIEDEWLDYTGSNAVWGDPDYSLLERLGARPTFEVNGIVGGYTGEGSKTIIPSEAHAKVTMRLVPNQDPHKIQESFIQMIESLIPTGIEFASVERRGAAFASVGDLNHPAMMAATQACQEVFDQDPIYQREGGSIPVVGRLQRILGLETILLGFGLPTDNIHSPNEKFYLPNFYSGIETVIHFLGKYGHG